MEFEFTSASNDLTRIFNQSIDFFFNHQPYDCHAEILEKIPFTFVKIYHYYEGADSPKGQEKIIELHFTSNTKGISIQVQLQSINPYPPLFPLSNAAIYWPEIVYDLAKHLEIPLSPEQYNKLFPEEHLKLLRVHNLYKTILIIIGVFFGGYYVVILNDVHISMIFLLFIIIGSFYFYIERKKNDHI